MEQNLVAQGQTQGVRNVISSHLTLGSLILQLHLDASGVSLGHGTLFSCSSGASLPAPPASAGQRSPQVYVGI